MDTQSNTEICQRRAYGPMLYVSFFYPSLRLSLFTAPLLDPKYSKIYHLSNSVAALTSIFPIHESSSLYTHLGEYPSSPENGTYYYNNRRLSRAQTVWIKNE